MDPVGIGVVITAAAWIALELVLIATGKPTVSARVQTAYLHYPSLGVLAGLGVGLLMAHFFWH